MMGKLLPAMHSAGPVLPARLAKSWEITQWAGKVDVYTCGSLSSNHQKSHEKFGGGGAGGKDASSLKREAQAQL